MGGGDKKVATYIHYTRSITTIQIMSIYL